MHLHLEKKTNNYHCHGRLLTSEGFLAETRVKEETSTNHIYHILRILPVLAHNKIHHQVSRSSNTLTTKSQNQNPTPSQINLGCSFLNASTISVRVIFNHKARHKQHLIVKLRFFFLNICLVVKYTSKRAGHSYHKFSRTSRWYQSLNGKPRADADEQAEGIALLSGGGVCFDGVLAKLAEDMMEFM